MKARQPLSEGGKIDCFKHFISSLKQNFYFPLNSSIFYLFEEITEGREILLLKFFKTFWMKANSEIVTEIMWSQNKTTWNIKRGRSYKTFQWKEDGSKSRLRVEADIHNKKI